jgi:hypothetical protein
MVFILPVTVRARRCRLERFHADWKQEAYRGRDANRRSYACASSVLGNSSAK